MIQIYLIEPNSFIGYLITFITGSKYSHAAIAINGILYDSSEKRGDFNVSDVHLNKRKYVCYELKGNLSEWLAMNIGREYDWVGVIGWLFKANDKTKFYCFEAIYSALMYLNIVKETKKSLSGDDLKDILEKYGKIYK